MAKYYGIVLSNGQSKICTEWGHAQEFIKTCPSGAQYRKFSQEPDAQDYINGILSHSKSAAQGDLNPEAANLDISSDHVIAYVDGSFNANENKWGYGAVMFPSHDSSKMFTLSGSGTVYANSRNVTGEIYGAMKAVSEAIKRGFKRITIYHDYQGVSAWATGAWKANMEMTQKYKDWMNGKRDFIEINFVKVTGHEGVIFNEMADGLAKKGCGAA